MSLVKTFARNPRMGDCDNSVDGGCWLDAFSRVLRSIKTTEAE